MLARRTALIAVVCASVVAGKSAPCLLMLWRHDREDSGLDDRNHSVVRRGAQCRRNGPSRYRRLGRGSVLAGLEHVSELRSAG